LSRELEKQRPIHAHAPLEYPERREETGAQRKERRCSGAAAHRESERRERDRAGVAAGELESAGDGEQQQQRQGRKEERRLHRKVEVFAGETRTLGQPFTERARPALHEHVGGGKRESTRCDVATAALSGRWCR